MIESATRLRRELKRPAAILFGSQNYLAKIVSDAAFVVSSELGKLFRLGSRFDPFFLSASQPIPLLARVQNTLQDFKLPVPRSAAKSRRTRSKSPTLALTMPVGTLYRRIKIAEAVLAGEIGSVPRSFILPGNKSFAADSVCEQRAGVSSTQPAGSSELYDFGASVCW